jgi:mono/diheme cytochrome c family protein
MRAVVAAALIGIAASVAMAETGAGLTAQERRGQVLLVRLCAPCHAIARTGASPMPDAPAFRTLSRRYKIEALEEALAEGLISGHPEMPEFHFSGEEVGAIVAYLNAIQAR